MNAYINYAAVNLFLGVVAGIITYVIIGFTISIFRKIVLPWYQNLIYKGINIRGEWLGYAATIEGGEYVVGPDSESTVILNQQGNKIYGELLLTKQPSGEKCRKLFEFEGTFVDTILMCNSKARDSNNMGKGAFLMKLTENGAKLKGSQTYISAYDWSTINTRQQVWVRK